MQRLSVVCLFTGLILTLLTVGCGGGGGGVAGGGSGGSGGQEAFTLTSTAFSNNGAIPLKYASANLGGQNVSPPLQWSNPPSGTRSFVITCIDLDAGNFVHWVIYDIPATLSALPENVPKQSQAQINGATVKQGQNDFDGVGYGGPEPPLNERHRYQFTVYALSVDTLNLPAGATLQQVNQAMQGKILSQATLIGTFQH